MSLGQFSAMDLKGAYDVEHMSSTSRIQHELWPLDGIDPKKAKFPCCLIWTPLPVVSWLAPFIGHVGIGREDGTILDFSGSNVVNVDDFSFGAAARYFQLDREQVLVHEYSLYYLHLRLMHPCICMHKDTITMTVVTICWESRLMAM